MTASTISSSARPAGRTGSTGRLSGVGPLFRKDLADWRHGKRLWVVLTVTTLILVLTAANGAITSWVVANTPGAEAPSEPISLAPLDNFMAAIASQFILLVAILGAMSLLVAEREHGTLAWVASKPVSRPAIWVSKWLAAAVALSVIAGLLPMLVTFAVSSVLYGLVDIGAALVVAAGVVASVTFITAVVLAASTVISNQAAVAAIGFAVLFIPQIVVGLLPGDIGAFLPTSILPWAMGLAIGADVGLITPIAWAASLVILAAFAAWRMDKMEL
jgi:ABC-2 type transport system permease protein